MNTQAVARPISSFPKGLEKRKNLSSAEREARMLLKQANDAVADSPAGQFMVRQESPEGYATLVATVFQALWMGQE